MLGKKKSSFSARQKLIIERFLATGGSAIKAIEVLKDHGVREEKILFVNLLSCPEGIKSINSTYPQVQIITADVDDKLNEAKFIVPGLGDFGCRKFDF